MTFGLDQCPGCGSGNVRQRSYQHNPGGPPPVCDVVTVLACDNCGRNTAEGESGE